MKKIIVAAFLIAGIPAFARKINVSKIPEAVKTSFTKNFQGIMVDKWEMENGRYEANFRQNDQKMAALFEPNGTWLETETKIDSRLLPIKTSMYIKNKYSGCCIKEAAKLKLANGDDNYVAEVNGVDLVFDANGKFLEEVKHY